MFPSRITAPLPPTPQSEDIFSAALATLFTDDVQNSHGVPGSHVTYHSPRFGKIELQIPRFPDVEEGRNLFAHYLWNAGVICGDGIERSSHGSEEQNGAEGMEGSGDETGSRVEWDRRYWDVTGKKVLELGAGTALPSIISALSGASSTTITDHPSSPALTTGSIEQNVKSNVLERSRPGETIKTSTSSTAPFLQLGREVNIFGYTWGTTTFYNPSSYGQPAAQQPSKFDRIVIADCLWMPSQHVNLVKTVLHYLKHDDPLLSQSESHRLSCALVVAGFHTDREVVRHFFEVATGEYLLPSFAGDEDKDAGIKNEEDNDSELKEVKGQLKAAEIFEIDVNGLRRGWEPVRVRESKEAAKRWCVVAVLVRR